MKERIDVPIVETYDSIMQRYTAAQAKVLLEQVRKAIKPEGLMIPSKPTNEHFRQISDYLKSKGMKLVGCICVLKARRLEGGDEEVTQLVFADIVPESVSYDQYRDDICRVAGVDKDRSKFFMCDFSGGSAGLPQA